MSLREISGADRQSLSHFQECTFKTATVQRAGKYILFTALQIFEEDITVEKMRPLVCDEQKCNKKFDLKSNAT